MNQLCARIPFLNPTQSHGFLEVLHCSDYRYTINSVWVDVEIERAFIFSVAKSISKLAQLSFTKDVLITTGVSLPLIR